MRRFLLLSLSCLLLNVSAAFAGLSIQPARAEVVLPAGGTFEGSYNVTNQSEESAVVNVEFRDWFVLPENKDIPIEQWLTVPVKQVELKAGENRDITYSVHVPTSAQGILVGMVSFVPQAQEGSNITMVISAALFATVAGTEKKEWSMSDIRLVVSPQKTMQAQVLVTNKGNVHLRPLGELAILKKGKVVASMIFKEGRPVYPGTSRPLVANSDGQLALEPGKYVLKASVSAGGEKKEMTARLKVKKNGIFKIK